MMERESLSCIYERQRQVVQRLCQVTFKLTGWRQASFHINSGCSATPVQRLVRLSARHIKTSVGREE
jgi:hypothetical protein